jgi:hypothetical protein
MTDASTAVLTIDLAAIPEKYKILTVQQAKTTSGASE